MELPIGDEILRRVTELYTLIDRSHCNDCPNLIDDSRYVTIAIREDDDHAHASSAALLFAIAFLLDHLLGSIHRSVQPPDLIMLNHFFAFLQ